MIEEIKNLKTLYESKAKLDLFLKDRNVESIPDRDFIKSVLKLQNNQNICFLCGSKDRLEEINKWNDLLKNEYSKEKSSLIIKFESIIDIINQLNNFKDTMNGIIPKTFKFINEVKKEIINFLDKINNNNFEVSSSRTKRDIEELVTNTNNLKTEMIIYCISQNYKKIIGSKYQIDNIPHEIKNNKDELDNEMSKQGESISREVNNVLNNLHFGKKIKIKTDKSGGNYKYSYTIDDKSVNVLSEGNRHKLALAFFIVSINQRDLKNKTIIFDDPVLLWMNSDITY